ncbi:lymphocyte function-associated antigen 3 isoform x2 [Limosa lapponica baueri]|uniref:Lymphocyte function-associated antigen 3 isoform x2 n=1 Tax=Limosa lapponica baueri TaxID=1758121 RepID=A0A2I0TYI2_LIMLA|nr:lymphocyte function-associated antigen 3 isoform x2 [Limosa lapponica baueri]
MSIHVEMCTALGSELRFQIIEETLLSCKILDWTAHVHCENVFGIVGENFTFPVKIDQKTVEIMWTKNKNKVAEWEGQNKTTYFPSFRNRGLLNMENGSLTIFNLENNDAGTYVLEYLDSVNKKYNLTFILAVLAPPSEPEISCNISGDDLVLKCTANFQEPLKYTWKFSSSPVTHQTQEVSVPKNVDASEKATCFIQFSQMEKSSEISLTQCFPDKRGRTKLATRNADQRNTPVCGSANSSQVADSENEKPEADIELNEDSTLKGKQMVNDGVKQEDISKEESSSLQDKHVDDHGVDDHGVNEGEVTQGAEDGNKDRSNSPSCSEEEMSAMCRHVLLS